MIDRRQLISGTATLALFPCAAVELRAQGAMTVTEAPARAVLVNQVGYLPGSSKIAILQGLAKVTAARLVDAQTLALIGEFPVSRSKRDRQTGFSLSQVDFSSLKKAGNYRLLAGTLASPQFRIGNDVYKDLLRLLLRSYYLQRCGSALSDTETNLHHPLCHAEDGLFPRADGVNNEGEMLGASGGWHDAGDFGKYVATAAVALGRVLSAYELYPGPLAELTLNIPQGARPGEPDVLVEMRVGLDWMARMQRADGAVYRKLSGAQWPTAIAPHEDLQPRFVYGVSTPETAKFAAVMALASRTYKQTDPYYAHACLGLAMKAWAYLETSGEQYIDWQKTDDTGSGPYVANDFDREDTLSTDHDDRTWAAAELYLSTGNEEFLQHVERYLERGEFGLNEWKNPAPLGLENLLLNSAGRSHEYQKKAGELLQSWSAGLDANVRRSGYGLSNERFIWGSNKIVAENGCALLAAYRLDGSRHLLKAAVRQVDYLLGVNPFAKSFVTGIGTTPVARVAHLYARAVKTDIPGLLVGGPNEDAQDSIAPAGRGILSYLDNEKSYATNEYAIDYNASLIGLLAMLVHVHEDLGHSTGMDL